MTAVRNFALTGVAGYVAPRHLRAIRETANRLVAAVDPHDSVGVLDSYFPQAAFFTEFERFDRHLEMLRRGSPDRRVDYLSICSPNHLHDAHIRLALRLGIDAICEKPLVLNPWNLDALARLQQETGRRALAVLQLRLHPALLQLRDRLSGERRARRPAVRLSYVTPRGAWYRYSWKGDVQKSGGLITNIGVHLFDLLFWLFGSAVSWELHHSDASRAAGFLELGGADVTWFLSIDRNDLPADQQDQTPLRSLSIDGEEICFSGGTDDLYTRVYEECLAGRGCGIEDARPSLEMVYRLRNEPQAKGRGPRHPLLGDNQ